MVFTQSDQLLIGRIGSFSQAASLVLVALLIAALSGSVGRREYLTRWGYAWFAMLGAVAMLGLRFTSLSGISGLPFADLPDDAPDIQGIMALYIACKFAFLGFLLTGTRLLTSPEWHPPRRWITALVAAPGLALAVGVADGLDHAMLWQVVVAVPVMVACAVLMFQRTRETASLGTYVLLLAFWCHALLWTLYGMGYLESIRGTNSGWLGILRFSPLLDTTLQTLLCYGMVLVVQEDTTRERRLAHEELQSAHQQLRRAAYHDPLSGAYNRRAFAENIGLERLVAAASVVVVDIDNLKAVNDSLGHEAGDVLIAHVATALRAALRAEDAMYRWGGDEFLLLLPQTSVARAVDRIETALAAAPSVRISGVLLPSRASVGAVPLSSPTDLEDAIRRADRAMYEVKARRWAPPEVVSVS